jgi:Zn-dependent protease/CBS domain-containing protein
MKAAPCAARGGRYTRLSSGADVADRSAAPLARTMERREVSMGSTHGGFRLGRVFGIELRIDWSWIFIFVLLTWNLFAVFSQTHADWPTLESLGLSLCASLLFFTCIVVHELAHSLMARRLGVQVRSITLFLFGGVSNIEREPPSPAAEFLTAIVGPVTSLILGLAFLWIASLVIGPPADGAADALSQITRLGPLSTLLLWLGPVNLVIGVFNMVPGFPLDGGRVLRAVVWSVTGNLRAATTFAAGCGRLIGWLFIACGIAMSLGMHIPFFGTGLASGIWMAFIGWFLQAAAAQASTRLALDDALTGITVEQLMRRDIDVVTPDLPLEKLVREHLIRGDQRALAVVDDGELAGLVSIADVRTVRPDQWAEVTVGDVMKRRESLATAAPGDELSKAFERIARDDIGQMPVLDDRKLVGMLRRRDVTRWLELAWKPSGRTTASTRPPARGDRHFPGTPRAASG